MSKKWAEALVVFEELMNNEVVQKEKKYYNWKISQVADKGRNPRKRQTQEKQILWMSQQTCVLWPHNETNTRITTHKFRINVWIQELFLISRNGFFLNKI